MKWDKTTVATSNVCQKKILLHTLPLCSHELFVAQVDGLQWMLNPLGMFEKLSYSSSWELTKKPMSTSLHQTFLNKGNCAVGEEVQSFVPSRGT